MATELVIPRLPDQQQSPFFQAQTQQQPPPQWQQQQVLPSYAPPLQQPGSSSAQISPLSTSGSASPTSPKAYHTRQIRPLYMPAVLRPTEHPSKAPAARPRDDTNEDDDEDRALKSNSSFISLGSALGRLSRRSTGDSGKCVDDNWNLDIYPKPTGLPTREHWKPDYETNVCDHSTCRRTFSYFTRRHHCRRCGNIFCDFHSAFEVPLDQEANFNPRGVPVRACAYCYSQFKEWRIISRVDSRDSSTLSSSPGSTHTQQQQRRTTGSPLSTSPTAAMPVIGCKGRPTTATKTDVAVSVPRDWNWSTF